MEKQIKLVGKIENGKNDASHWLKKFNEEYFQKLGMKIYPGSLNIKLEKPFYFRSKDFTEKLIFMNKSEYGGERDILMIPCLICNTTAFLWRTTRIEDGKIDEFDQRLIEVITNIHLRSSFNLNTGDTVEVELA